MNDTTVARLQAITYAIALVLACLVVMTLCLHGASDILMDIGGLVALIFTYVHIEDRVKFHLALRKFQKEFREITSRNEEQS